MTLKFQFISPTYYKSSAQQSYVAGGCHTGWHRTFPIITKRVLLAGTSLHGFLQSLSFQCHPSAASTPEYPTAYSPSPCKCLTDISNLTWADPVPKLLCQTPCSFHFIFLVVQAKYLGVTLDPSVPSSSSSSPPANPISLNFKVNPESKHSSFLLIVQPRASHAF